VAWPLLLSHRGEGSLLRESAQLTPNVEAAIE
jgi:hypothetical protein